jgi:hypothetical protein
LTNHDEVVHHAAQFPAQFQQRMMTNFGLEYFG